MSFFLSMHLVFLLLAIFSTTPYLWLDVAQIVSYAYFGGLSILWLLTLRKTMKELADLKIEATILLTCLALLFVEERVVGGDPGEDGKESIAFFVASFWNWLIYLAMQSALFLFPIYRYSLAFDQSIVKIVYQQLRGQFIRDAVLAGRLRETGPQKEKKRGEEEKGDKGEKEEGEEEEEEGGGEGEDEDEWRARRGRLQLEEWLSPTLASSSTSRIKSPSQTPLRTSTVPLDVTAPYFESKEELLLHQQITTAPNTPFSIRDTITLSSTSSSAEMSKLTLSSSSSSNTSSIANTPTASPFPSMTLSSRRLGIATGRGGGETEIELIPTHPASLVAASEEDTNTPTEEEGGSVARKEEREEQDEGGGGKHVEQPHFSESMTDIQSTSPSSPPSPLPVHFSQGERHHPGGRAPTPRATALPSLMSLQQTLRNLLFREMRKRSDKKRDGLVEHSLVSQRLSPPQPNQQVSTRFEIPSLMKFLAESKQNRVDFYRFSISEFCQENLLFILDANFHREICDDFLTQFEQLTPQTYKRRCLPVQQPTPPPSFPRPTLGLPGAASTTIRFDYSDRGGGGGGEGRGGEEAEEDSLSSFASPSPPEEARNPLEYIMYIHDNVEAMFRDYFLSDSVKAINVSHAHRHDVFFVREALYKLVRKDTTGRDECLESVRKYVSVMFDECKEELIRILEADAFARFILKERGPTRNT
jgi:hypothetical protein